MKYEVRKCDEMGHDYREESFDTQEKAWEYENLCSRYDKGWHFYTKPIEENK